jgi:hypothetical protein
MAIPSTGYITANVSSLPSSSLTDFSLVIDSDDWDSGARASFFAACNSSDGTRLRVAKLDGTTELAFDPIIFNTGTPRLLIRVLYSGTLPTSGTVGVNIYPATTDNSSYARTDTYGQNNAYDSNWAGYFPDGGITNRKVATDGTAHGVTPGGGSDGPFGVSTQYPGGTGSYVECNINMSATNFTFSAWSHATDLSNASTAIMSARSSGSSHSHVLKHEQYSGTDNVGMTCLGPGDNASGITSPTALAHVACSVIASGATFLYSVNGSHDTTNPSSVTAITGEYYIGCGFYNNSEGDNLVGHISEVQFHTTNRNQAWMDEEYAQVSNNASFWGTWTWDAGVTYPIVTDVDTDEDIYVGQTSVVITGTNFETDGANSRVRIDSSPAGTGTSQTQVDTSWADTSIQFTVSLGALSYGANYLFVRNDSSNESETGFAVNLYEAMTATSLNDTTIYSGQTGIELNGSGFGSSQGSSKIYLCDSSDGSGVNVAQTVTSWTDTKVTFTVVPGALSLGTVYVLVGRNQASQGDTGERLSPSQSATLVAVPTIPAITNAEDEQLTAGETDFVITGTGFESLQGTGTVELCPSSTYGSPVAQTVTGWSDTEITITGVKGALSYGTNYLFVTNDTGYTNATGYAITLLEPASDVGLFQGASFQSTITSSGMTTTAFLISDE